MAITWAASLPAVGANNGGNVTLTFSNLVNAAGGAYTLVQNDWVLAAFASSGTADYAMPTPAGWTELAEHYADGTIDTNLAVYVKKMTATPDTSVTFSGPGGASNGTIGVAHVLKDADITALDVAAVLASGTGTSVPNPGSVTPVTTGAFIAVVGAGVASAGATFSHTDLNTTTNHFRTGNHAETNDIAIGFGWKEDWTSGAFDPAVWTGGNVNAANSWAAITLAIKPQPATQDLTPSLFTNSQSFFAPTVAPGSVSLTPSLFSNSQSFFSPTVTPGPVDLTPSLFTNSQGFFSPSIGLGLTPSLFTNTQVFYSPTVSSGSTQELLPELFTNSQIFHTPTVTIGPPNLSPELFVNTNVFFPPTVEVYVDHTIHNIEFALGRPFIHRKRKRF